MGYYDIDDILSDATRIPCRFNTTIPGLSYLDGNPVNASDNINNSIKKGTRLELPIWLAEFLAVSTIPPSDTEREYGDADPENEEDQAFVELLPPSYTSTQILNALKSAPTSLPLSTILKHYYAFIEKWATLFNDEELADVIIEVLKARVDEINNFAQVYKGGSSGAGDFISGLDEFEKSLFRVGNDSYREVQKWLRKET
jgi:GINS complex subunit 3